MDRADAASVRRKPLWGQVSNLPGNSGKLETCPHIQITFGGGHRAVREVISRLFCCNLVTKPRIDQSPSIVVSFGRRRRLTVLLSQAPFLEEIMRTLIPMAFAAILLCRAPAGLSQEDLPKAIQEVLKQYQEEAAAIEKGVEPAIQKKREKAATELKKIQDTYCKEAKLDEAVAVRDVIRNLQAGGHMEPGEGLVPAVNEILKAHQQEEAEIYEKAEADAKKWKEKTLAELQKLQDTYCRDAKLDEAVAVRSVIRGFLDGGASAVRADPGNLAHPESDIGKVFYYNVIGYNVKDATATGAIYGSDVYVPGSTLSMVAVHAGVLKEGQHGIVKVTVLAGQQGYAATTRNGITSNAYGAATSSFKVERAYGFLPKIGYGKVLADPGTLSTYRGQNGKVFLFEVTGRNDLSIAGTDIYTDDSGLATAAVHAGVLNVGQTGVVRVTIMPGQTNYVAATRNGVNSIASPNYPGSYKVERARVRGKSVRKEP